MVRWHSMIPISFSHGPEISFQFFFSIHFHFGRVKSWNSLVLFTALTKWRTVFNITCFELRQIVLYRSIRHNSVALFVRLGILKRYVYWEKNVPVSERSKSETKCSFTIARWFHERRHFWQEKKTAWAYWLSTQQFFFSFHFSVRCECDCQ